MPAKQDVNQSEQPSPPKVIRVLVVAGHGVLQRAFVDLIKQQPDIEVCASLHNLSDADRSLKELAATTISILDWPLADRSAALALAGLLHTYPAARWLAVSLYDDPFSVKQALDMGMHGYVTKLTAAETICAAIRALSAGRHYFSPDVLDVLPLSFARKSFT